MSLLTPRHPALIINFKKYQISVVICIISQTLHYLSYVDTFKGFTHLHIPPTETLVLMISAVSQPAPCSPHTRSRSQCSESVSELLRDLQSWSPAHCPLWCQPQFWPQACEVGQDLFSALSPQSSWQMSPSLCPRYQSHHFLTPALTWVESQRGFLPEEWATSGDCQDPSRSWETSWPSPCDCPPLSSRCWGGTCCRSASWWSRAAWRPRRCHEDGELSPQTAAGWWCGPGPASSPGTPGPHSSSSCDRTPDPGQTEASLESRAASQPEWRQNVRMMDNDGLIRICVSPLTACRRSRSASCRNPSSGSEAWSWCRTRCISADNAFPTKRN